MSSPDVDAVELTNLVDGPAGGGDAPTSTTPVPLNAPMAAVATIEREAGDRRATLPVAISPYQDPCGADESSHDGLLMDNLAASNGQSGEESDSEDSSTGNEHDTVAAVNTVLKIWERKKVKRQNHTLDAENDAVVRRKNLIMLVFVMVGNSLAIAILQLGWDAEALALVPHRPAVEVLKCINILVGICLIGLHVDYYILQAQIILNHETIKGHIPERAGCVTVFRKELIWEFVGGIIIFAIMPIPLVDFTKPGMWWLNDKWALCQVFRLYVGFRVIRDHNPIYKSRTEILVSDYGDYVPTFNWFTTIKFLFFKKPGTLVFAISAYCIVVMTYTLYVVAREEAIIFGDIAFVMYYAAAILTTIGASDDNAPEAPLTRFVVMITASLGIVVASLLVALLTTKLTLSLQEHSAHQWILVQSHRSNESHLSASLVKLRWKLKRETDPKKIASLEKKLGSVREKLAFVRRKIAKHGDQTNLDPRIALQGEQLARTRLQVIRLERQMKEALYHLREMSQRMGVPALAADASSSSMDEDLVGDLDHGGGVSIFVADENGGPRSRTSMGPF